MTDFTPFEDLLRGHAGLLEDTAHDRWLRARTLFEARAYREHDPNEPYPHLLIGRALQRKGRREEAQPHLRLAELLGGYRV